MACCLTASNACIYRMSSTRRSCDCYRRAWKPSSGCRLSLAHCVCDGDLDGQIHFTTNAIDQIQRKSRPQILALGPYFLPLSAGLAHPEINQSGYLQFFDMSDT